MWIRRWRPLKEQNTALHKWFPVWIILSWRCLGRAAAGRALSLLFFFFFFFNSKSKAQISTRRGAGWVRKSRAPVVVGGQLASWWICTTSLLEKPTAFLNFLPAAFLQYRTPGSSVSLGWLLLSVKYFESNKMNRSQIKSVAFPPVNLPFCQFVSPSPSTDSKRAEEWYFLSVPMQAGTSGVCGGRIVEGAETSVRRIQTSRDLRKETFSLSKGLVPTQETGACLTLHFWLLIIENCWHLCARRHLLMLRGTRCFSLSKIRAALKVNNAFNQPFHNQHRSRNPWQLFFFFVLTLET